MTAHLHAPTRTGRSEASVSSRGTPMLWLLTAALLFFLVPWIGTDRLGLQPDLYYLIYFTVAIVFFTAFVTTHAAALRPLWTEHLWQSPWSARSSAQA